MLFRLETQYSREAVLPHQLQQELSITWIGLLLPNPHSCNLSRISGPQLAAQFREQALEPSRMPSCFQADSYIRAAQLQITVELLPFSITVLQSLLAVISGFRIYKCDLLYPRVISQPTINIFDSFSRASFDGPYESKSAVVMESPLPIRSESQ